jgi:hypothetical protein
MKMVKTLLLGSAAGLVAVTAGQAADLPVKAKPVEYVKICSLYGAGFYYMPGTDLCIKIGGWVRAESVYGNINGNVTWGPFNANYNNRTTSNEAFRARGYITADVRNQTEYGTVRGYIAVGLSTNDTGLQVASLVDSANRAFVQWAGMTAGLSQSFFDFYSVPAMQYRGGYLPASDTGDGGWWVWAYTAQFGGGFSATISTEARRTTQIIDQSCGGAGFAANCGSTAPGAFPGAGTYNNSGDGGLGLGVGSISAVLPGNGAYGGMQTPDIVGNLRVDQAWGGAQIMGAAHYLNPTYYSQVNATGSVAGISAIGAGGTLPSAGAANWGPNSITGGHPSDQWGWVVGAGLKINTPFIGQGDWLQAQFNYTQGALRYVFNTPGAGNYGMVNGGNEAYGVMSDCVYGGTLLTGTQSGCERTSAWGFNAGFEHYWTPAWHTSLYGAYAAVMYDTAANNMLCAAPQLSSSTLLIKQTNGSGFGTAAVANAGCDNNWSTWGVGSRTQWDVTKTFYLGVEVLYTELNSASPTGGTNGSLGGTQYNNVPPSGATFQEAHASAWSFTVRAHRDFLP